MICDGFKNRDFFEVSLCEVAFEIFYRLDSNYSMHNRWYLLYYSMVTNKYVAYK
jgi:hypothetical protein